MFPLERLRNLDIAYALHDQGMELRFGYAGLPSEVPGVSNEAKPEDSGDVMGENGDLR
jgi:hypothetical protein